MSSTPNYYTILGVTKDASEEDIKKAYRKLAKDNHPDRMSHAPEEVKAAAAAKFAEISKAYETLTDTEKRRQYDAGELDENGNHIGGGMPNGFANIFKGFPFNMGMGGQQQKPNLSREKSDPTKLTIELPLEDFYNGKNVKHNITTTINCRTCNGTGAESKVYIKSCTHCGGSGIRVQMRQFGPGMMQQLQSPCTPCKGQGKYIEPGHECTICKGKQQIQETKEIEIVIKPGTVPGTRMVFAGYGNQHIDYGYPGDLFVYVGEHKPGSGTFRREGDNLVMMRSINLQEALTNYTCVFKHLDGRIIKAITTQVIRHGHIMRIKGEGMPILTKTGNDTGRHGDLIIHFDVKFPKELDPERRELINKILTGVFPHQPKQIWDIDMDKIPPNDIHEYVMEETTENTHQNNNDNNSRTTNSHDDNDGDFDDFTSNQSRPQNVQCAQQ